LIFYKSLFGREESSEVRLEDDFWLEEEMITSSENDLLEADFTEEEVREAVFGSYADGAPGPNGLSFLFYQVFWEVIKKDLMMLVNCFDRGQLDLDRLNYGMITLIPKEHEAKTLKKFRPISLLNCSFKIFAKMLNNRLVVVADRLVASNQTTFIKDRYIFGECSSCS
jgi:hypothetical protein